MKVADVVESAKSLLNQRKSVQDKLFNATLGFMTEVDEVDGDEYWSVPNVNTIKVNSGATLFDVSHCFNFSYFVVARNYLSELVEAISSCEQTPEVVEAIDIREALSWIKKKDWPQVEIETDCLPVIQAIQSSTVMFSYFGRVIDECKQVLNELKDRHVSLKFVKRSANKMAHYLARYNGSIVDRVWRTDNAHSEFIDVMLNDLVK